MVDRKINYSDLFDFSDTAELDKALQSIEKLNANYTRMAETIRTAFGESKTAIRQMAADCSSSLQQLNATQEQNRQGILKYAEASEKLVTAQATLTKSEKSLVAAEQLLAQQSEKLEDVFVDSYRAVQSLQKAISDIEHENQKFKSEMEGNRAVFEKNSNAIHENNMVLETLRQKLGDAQRQLKTAAQTVSSSSGSYKQMQSELKRLQEEYKGLTKEERDSEKTGKLMLQQIKVLKEGLKQMSGELGATASSSSAVRTQLNAMIATLIEMKAAGLEGSQAYTEMIAAAADLKDNLSDVQKEIRNMSSDNSIFEGITEAAEGTAGVFAVMQGAMALAGVESEDLQETMVKLQSAIALVSGLTAINNMLQKESAVNTALLAIKRNILNLATLRSTVATGANTRATLAQVVAQKALNAVMKMSPAGWLLIIVTALAAAYTLLSREANKGYEAMKKSLELSTAQTENAEARIKNIEREYNARIQEQEAIVERAKLEKKPLQEIQREEKKLADIRKEEADKQAEIVEKDIKNLDKLKYKLETAQLAAARMEKYINSEKKNANDQYSFVPNPANLMGGDVELKATTENLELVKKIVSEIDKKVQNAQNASLKQQQAYTDTYTLELKHLEELKKASRDDILAGAEYRAIMARKSFEAETAALKEQAKIRRDIALQEENLSANQRKVIQAKYIAEIESIDNKYQTEKIQREKALIDAELLRVERGTKEELNLKIAATEKDYKIKKKTAENNKEELIRLEAEREKAITDLTNTYNKERKEFALNLKIDSINAQLETVIVGSEREYQLKKELVETQNELEKTGIEYTEQNTKDREALIAAANARELAAKEKLEKDKAAAEIRHNAQQSVNANEKQAAQNDLKMATNGESHKDNWKLKKENDQLELDSIALQLEANQNLWDKQLISEEEYLNTRHSLEMEAMQKRVDMARKEEDQKRELIQATLGTIQEAISFSAGMFKDVSDQRLNVLQSDMEREKEEYEGNKMAQEAVERKYNARMRQEKRKQAVIDKQVAVFDAIIKAYQAYNAALTIPVAGPALAAINLALGLAQAMYIQAKPIPEFWRGSQNTPQGLAKVFERGGELIEYKGQRYYGDKPAIVDLPRGAKVYPNWHEKTKEFERLSQVTDLKNFYLNNAAEITGKREIISLESRKLDEGAISAAVSKAIRGIPVFQTIFDERGVTTYIGRVASCRELQHERIRTGGNG